MRIFLLMLLVLLPMVSISSQSEYWGYVVAVKDGDTPYIKKLPNGKALPASVNAKSKGYRLANIDAPEYSWKCKRNQQYGYESTDELTRLINHKKVYVDQHTVDRYGRPVVTIYLSNQKQFNVNHYMVKSGAAWVYREYNKDRNLLAEETRAKLGKKGLWANPNPVKPSKWRKLGKGC